LRIVDQLLDEIDVLGLIDQGMPHFRKVYGKLLSIYIERALPEIPELGQLAARVSSEVGVPHLVRFSTEASEVDNILPMPEEIARVPLTEMEWLSDAAKRAETLDRLAAGLTPRQNEPSGRRAWSDLPNRKKLSASAPHSWSHT